MDSDMLHDNFILSNWNYCHYNGFVGGQFIPWINFLICFPAVISSFTTSHVPTLLLCLCLINNHTPLKSPLSDLHSSPSVGPVYFCIFHVNCSFIPQALLTRQPSTFSGSVSYHKSSRPPLPHVECTIHCYNYSFAHICSFIVVPFICWKKQPLGKPTSIPCLHRSSRMWLEKPMQLC